MPELKGRVAIITGGGRGIGASIARQFAEEGAAVVINDLGTSTDGTGADASPAEELAASIRAAGGSAVADNGDITETETGQRLVDTAVKEFGGLHILVNVAGILRDRMIFNMEEGDWDAVIKTHLRGHYSTVRPASAYWREQKNPEGNYRIINFTSFSALHGSPGQANYAAAKMGVIGLTYSLAQGLARYGVTANAVAPGAMTRLSGTVSEDKRPKERFFSREDDRLSPDNVAPIVTYLASERSGWLTGRTLSAMGYEVGLYNNPEVIRSVTTTGPWDFEQLATGVEQSFKPVANGLPQSMFVNQVKKD